MKKPWIIGAASLFIFVCMVGTYLFFQATTFKHVAIDQTDQTLGIGDIPLPTIEKLSESANTSRKQRAEEPSAWEGQIVNIALFGLDRRNKNEHGRSDTMMILTLDFVHRKLKLTSLMRDLETPVEGYGTTKLNHAYAYGGPELAIKTINQTFGTDIRNYVTVDFFTLEKIIDALGGVEIDVKSGEVPIMNSFIKGSAATQGEAADLLEAGGVQALNGLQTVAYTRVRYYGNGDFERTERQRKVLTLLLNKAKQKGVSAAPRLLLDVMPNIETSLERSDVLSLIYEYFKGEAMLLEQERFPVDGTWKSGVNSEGDWVLRVDSKLLKDQVQSYIYKDEKPSMQ